MRILGAILAGGKSSRFGSDKALAQVHDKPLIVHVARSLQQCDAVVVVGRMPGTFAEQMLRSVQDHSRSVGPVAGLLTALGLAKDEGFSHVFLTSCDTWGLHAQWPRRLGEHDAHVVAIFDGRWQPMCSLWSVESLPVVLEKTGELAHAHKGPAFQGIMNAVGAVAVAPFEGWECVVSVNTPADLPV